MNKILCLMKRQIPDFVRTNDDFNDAKNILEF